MAEVMHSKSVPFL